MNTETNTPEEIARDIETNKKALLEVAKIMEDTRCAFINCFECPLNISDDEEEIVCLSNRVYDKAKILA